MIVRNTVGFAVVAALMAASGCASIVSDSKPEVGIYSMPSGARYDVTNSRGMTVSSGVTPGRVILEAGKGYFSRETYTVAFHKEGYADSITPMKTTINGWYWGNILFGGLIGMLIVDPLTGAMYALPDDATGNLVAKAPSSASAPSPLLPSAQITQQ